MDQLQVPHVSAALASVDGLAGLLGEYGCVIVDGFISAADLPGLQGELRKVVAQGPLGDNSFDGFCTRRVFDPLARTRYLDNLLTHPLIVGTADATIGSSQLGMTVLSDVRPGEVAQVRHRDGNAYPLPQDVPTFMMNTIWAIDDFTDTNGATDVSPGSHRPSSLRLVSEMSPDDFIPATMAAGSVLLYDGRLAHRAGLNRSSSGRLGLIIEYVPRWLRPNENHTLAVPKDIAVGLAKPLQELMGYNQYNSYMGFVGGKNPLDWLMS